MGELTKYDVVAVCCTEPHEERLIEDGVTKETAEVIVTMCVMRRGVDEEFFNVVPARVWALKDRRQ